MWPQSLPFGARSPRPWSGWFWLAASDMLSLAFPVLLARFLLVGLGKAMEKQELCTRLCVHSCLGTSDSTSQSLLSVPHPSYAAVIIK